MLRLLIIEHAPERADGVITLFETLKIEFELCRIYQNESLPEVGSLLGVIPAGGPMGVADIGNPKYPFLTREVEYFDHVIKAGIPILGICLGHQLIIHALGGQVSKAVVPEIGWSQVSLTDAGKSDLLFNGCSASYETFHYHFDEVSTLPPNAVVLAHSKYCQVQAFRIEGRPIWGVQYHPDIFPGHAAKILEMTAQRSPNLMTADMLQTQIKHGERVFDISISLKMIENFLAICKK